MRSKSRFLYFAPLSTIWTLGTGYSRAKETKKQKKKKLLISGYASRVASIFHLGKIEATLLAGYARGPNPPPSPSFFGTRAGLPSFLPLICIILFLSLSAHGSEERKDDRSWYCVGRLLSMNHLMSRVLPKFNESPRHLIELSVRFEPSFLAEMLSKSHYSLKWIRAHKSPSPLSIISELATGILPPFCWTPSPLPCFPSPKLTWIAGWVNIFA